MRMYIQLRLDTKTQSPRATTATVPSLLFIMPRRNATCIINNIVFRSHETRLAPLK